MLGFCIQRDIIVALHEAGKRKQGASRQIKAAAAKSFVISLLTQEIFLTFIEIPLTPLSPSSTG